MGWMTMEKLIAMCFFIILVTGCSSVNKEGQEPEGAYMPDNLIQQTVEEGLEEAEASSRMSVSTIQNVDMGMNGVFNVERTATREADANEYSVMLRMYSEIGQRLYHIPHRILVDTGGEDIWEFTSISFDDWNNEGFTDIRIRVAPDDTPQQNTHAFFLWNRKQGQFIFNEQLSALNDEGWLQTVEEGYGVGDIVILSEGAQGQLIQKGYRWSEGELILYSVIEDYLAQDIGETLVISPLHRIPTPEIIRKIIGEDAEIDRYHELRINDMAYSLFVTDYEKITLIISRLSNEVDGTYEYVQSFGDIGFRMFGDGFGETDIHRIILTDIDFDGVQDVLIFLGNFGNQGAAFYSGFLRRGDSYIRSNFEEIWSPRINRETEQFSFFSRNSAASATYGIYEFSEDVFVPMHKRTYEFDLEKEKWRVTILIENGREVEIVSYYEEGQVPEWEEYSVGFESIRG